MQGQNGGNSAQRSSLLAPLTTRLRPALAVAAAAAEAGAAVAPPQGAGLADGGAAPVREAGAAAALLGSEGAEGAKYQWWGGVGSPRLRGAGETREDSTIGHPSGGESGGVTASYDQGSGRQRDGRPRAPARCTARP